jgi:hypothetical protein
MVESVTTMLEQTSLSFTAMTRSKFLRCIKALQLRALQLEPLLSVLTAYLKLERKHPPIPPSYFKLKGVPQAGKMSRGPAHNAPPHLPDLPGAHYNPQIKEWEEKYAYLSPFAPDLGTDPPVLVQSHPFTRRSTFTCYINGCWRNFREKGKLDVHQRFNHSRHPLTTCVGVDSAAFGPFMRPGDDDDVLQRVERDRGEVGKREEKIEEMVRRMGFEFFERNVEVGFEGSGRDREGDVRMV